MSRRERAMVPDAQFTSYYGRPVVKASPWTSDIPAYLFLGGLAGGSSVLAAGADLTGRPVLRRASRITAFAGVTASFAALVHDLGRPSRFHHMLRVAKPSSPMSVGTWILAVYGPMAGLAAVSEARSRLPTIVAAPLGLLGRPAGLAAAGLGPAVAAYTAVLLSDTATPAWHDGYEQLPFIFVGSAAAAAGGMGLLTAPTVESGPARRLAIGGAALDLAAGQRRERAMGLPREALSTGAPGRWMKAAKALTAFGALGAAASGRSRVGSAAAGVTLLAGSVCTRFGIFSAGQASARDPRFTVVPQRDRVHSAERLSTDLSPALATLVANGQGGAHGRDTHAGTRAMG